MRTLQTNDCNDPAGFQYALRRGAECWALGFDRRKAIFNHELGALGGCFTCEPPLRVVWAGEEGLSLK
jgi:hypothetical protein